MYSISCVKNQVNRCDSFLVTRLDRQTDPNALPTHSSPGARVIINARQRTETARFFISPA